MSELINLIAFQLLKNITLLNDTYSPLLIYGGNTFSGDWSQELWLNECYTVAGTEWRFQKHLQYSSEMSYQPFGIRKVTKTAREHALQGQDPKVTICTRTL